LRKKPKHATKSFGMKEVWSCYATKWIAWPDPRGQVGGRWISGAGKQNYER